MDEYALKKESCKSMRVILASKSPRRKEILENLGVKFEVVVADADESSDITDPELLVQALAKKKGRAVLEKLEDPSDCLLIACDTLVYAEGEFLGKPRDREDARRMMRLLSGRSHAVVSGLYLFYGGKEVGAAAVTRVTFAELTEEEIEDYVNTAEPYDKAGGYAVQGRACVFVSGLEGDYFNVVGLPVNLLYRTLKKEFGINIREL
jgi:septum formation protein